MGIRYLTERDIVIIHDLEVVPLAPLTNPSGLAAAVARPAMTVGGEDAYPSLELKAAALFEALIQNHCFLDGNKRTAVLAAMSFYALNHRVLEIPLAVFYPVAIGVVAHKVSLVAVARVFAASATAIPEPPADD